MWTVSAFVRRDGRWQRLWRTVEQFPDPLVLEAARVVVPSRVVEDRLRRAVRDILDVAEGERVEGCCVTHVSPVFTP